MLIGMKKLEDGSKKITMDGWKRLMKTVTFSLFLVIHLGSAMILGINENSFFLTGLSINQVFVLNPLMAISYFLSVSENNSQVQTLKDRNAFYIPEKHEEKLERDWEYF